MDDNAPEDRRLRFAAAAGTAGTPRSHSLGFLSNTSFFLGVVPYVFSQIRSGGAP
jgi:hypothetical protein